MLGDPETKKDYSAFLVNKGMSYYEDTVFFANEMNKYSHLDTGVQYTFYLRAVPPRKRFSKWEKKTSKSGADIEVLIKTYGYSANRALEALQLIPQEEIKRLRAKLDTGGKL